MEEAIKNFNKQFSWKPEIAGGAFTKVQPSFKPSFTKFVVGGMGGSHLGADLIRTYDPSVDLIIHRDYGIPEIADAKDRLFIASSYSGNTEETLDFAQTAHKKGFDVCTISIGGKLLQFARDNNLPHIVIPDTKIQPRSALGFSMQGLAVFLKNEKLQQDLSALSAILKPEDLAKEGEALGEELRSKVPVIYSSEKNAAIAYNWKIKMNETGKVPAFYNVFPELNHNEMTGFDIVGTTEGMSRRFHFVFITDKDDHPKIQKRMKVCEKLYKDRGLSLTSVPLVGKTKLEKIFTSLIIADWTALSLSQIYGTEAEEVPMVEEFKKLI